MRKDIVRTCIGIALGLLGTLFCAGPVHANANGRGRQGQGSAFSRRSVCR